MVPPTQPIRAETVMTDRPEFQRVNFWGSLADLSYAAIVGEKLRIHFPGTSGDAPPQMAELLQRLRDRQISAAANSRDGRQQMRV